MTGAGTARIAVLAGVLAVLLAACTGTADDHVSPPAPASASASVPSGLERFYGQHLTWSGCGGGFQCSRLTVPVDYGAPTGATARLALVRLRASSAKGRLGSLVVNPGGPGVSGVAYARAAQQVVSDAVRRHYDVVGFDPRGVGASDPLPCLDTKDTDALIGNDPTPDDPAEVVATLAFARHVAAECGAKGGALLAHLGTVDAARDLDVLRAALGDRRLTYLGKSYGTLLGAVYAQEFPTDVGRMVLDGAIDPALDADQLNLGQAEGFEVATRSFVEDCTKQQQCPLGSDPDRAVRTLRSMVAELDAHPLPTGDPARPLTEGRGTFGILSALYDVGYWPALRQGLAEMKAGRGTTILRLCDGLSNRGPDGFQSNQNTVIYAVNCLDRPDHRSLAQIQESVTRYERAAPDWGGYLAWSELPCTVWPATGDAAPTAVPASGSGPIVVVGTTRDPATPYAWAQALAKELDAGHLLTRDGDGHTAYRRGSSCIDAAVDAYYLRGTVPADGARCD